MQTRERAARPEDLTRLFVERANARDPEGMAELYAEDAVMAFPPGANTVGRSAIRVLCEQLVAGMQSAMPFEEPAPTIYYGPDLALTSTQAQDGSGTRVQVVRREPDGGWVRIIDRPEQRSPRPR
ncbi:MAG TPA: nuclear transport factor 2 family protein [Kineosporiaceae bacterium]|nr:nuclear transport factor 2 family protein [Kineosporiaceae bacterium]